MCRWNFKEISYTQITEYVEAKDYLFQAVNMCQSCYTQDHPALACTLFNLGVAYASTGEYETAVQHYKKAIKIQEEKLPSGNLCVIDIHNQIAAAYVKLKKFIEAQQHLKKCESIYENNNRSRKDPDFVRIMQNLKSVNKAVKRR
jgi:tetratricopeptide (TPR) repeat protein